MSRSRTRSIAGWAGLGGALAWAALSLVAAPPGRAQEEACPPPQFSPQLLTPLTGVHPRDAALVVGLAPGGSVTRVPPIELTRGRRRVSTVAETIAPGLVRVRPDTRRVYGRYTLAGVAGDPEVRLGRGTPSAAPTAPRLERVERYLVASPDGERTEVRAHFGFPVPQGVVAILVYWGADEEPDLFARATPTRDEAILFTQHGACPSLPPGASPPPAQGDVRVAFVDALGQVSAPSEARSLGN